MGPEWGTNKLMMYICKNAHIEKCFNDRRRILNADDLVSRVSDSETACKSSTEREIVLPLRLAIYSKAWIIFKWGYSENIEITRMSPVSPPRRVRSPPSTLEILVG